MFEASEVKRLIEQGLPCERSHRTTWRRRAPLALRGLPIPYHSTGERPRLDMHASMPP